MNTTTVSPAEDANPKASRNWIKPLVGIGLVAALVAAFRTLPLGDMLNSAIQWVDSLGIWAPIAFIAIYVFCVIFFVPGSVLTAAAGTLFGVVSGSIYVSIASTLGASLAFLIGRYGARNWVEKRIAGNKSFSAIDGAVAAEGWKIVGLTRLSPVFPFTLLNYGYGVTKVRFRDYLIASWIGMMPGTVLFVYVGSLGKAAAEGGQKSPAEWAMYGIGLVATIAVTVYVTKVAKRALGRRIENE